MSYPYDSSLFPCPPGLAGYMQHQQPTPMDVWQQQLLQQQVLLAPYRARPTCTHVPDRCAACVQADLVAKQDFEISAVYDRAHYENRCKDFMVKWRSQRQLTEGR